MTLKDARAAYDLLSGKLSDIVRQLSFAGIAVIWMFRSGGEASGKIPFEVSLILPLTSFATALACDLLHYAWASLAWSNYANFKEKKGTKDADDVDPPDWINWPSIGFFYVKTILCVFAYFRLLVFLKGKL